MPVPKEVVLIPTYHRPEMLFYCVSMIRAFEPNLPIIVFPDRGSAMDDELKCLEAFEGVKTVWVPEHHYHGNTYNVMEAFRFSHNLGFDLTYYIEDDVIVHPDFFKWHREVHEECPDIFASMGWIFNREAPISDDWMFQPWYYSIGTSFSLDKLGLIVRHASPLYYEDMAAYVGNNFEKSPVHDPDNIIHFEQDGLIQRILDEDKSQVVSPGMGRCTHIGTYGYNAGWEKRETFFEGCNSFEERLAKISEFVGDPYARAEVFGRAIVEREIGRVLPKREFHYRVSVREFESEFVSELTANNFPRRINSVTRTPDMQIVVSS